MKPAACPFCGEPARTDAGMGHATCGPCLGFAPVVWIPIEAWNKRAPVEPLAKMLLAKGPKLWYLLPGFCAHSFDDWVENQTDTTVPMFEQYQLSESLSKALSKTTEAIEMYADPDSYHAVMVLADRPSGVFADDFSIDHGGEYDREMPGKLARAALTDLINRNESVEIIGG